MDDQANGIGARPGAAERPQESGAAAPGRGGRMSRQRKTAAVLRLLRGEDLETVSRSLGVTAATLSGWRDAFLAAGEAALTSKPTRGEDLQSERLTAKLGAALIERDLRNEKIAILEANRPLARRRPRPSRRSMAGPTAWRWSAASGASPAQASTGSERRRPRRRYEGVAQSAPCRIPPCSRRSARSWPTAPSMARAIARSGPGCAIAASAPRCAACCG